MKLMSLLAKLAIHTKNRKLKNKQVSKASVGWHITHALLVIINVYKSLASSDPTAYQKEENKVRDYVLTNKKIKRGVAQSPQGVIPDKKAKKGYIKDLFDEAKKVIVQFEILPKGSFFAHHSLGHLTKKEAIKFLNIHTKHHLKIIKDIEEAEGES